MTTKRLMLIIMSVMLFLTVLMGIIVITRVGSLFQPTDTPDPTTGTNNSSVPSTSPSQPTEPSGTTPTTPTQNIPHTHSFEYTSKISPTCTAMGYTLYTCSCGALDTQDFVDAKGHNFIPGVPVIGTCEQDGYTPITCERCGLEDKENLVTAPGHDYQHTRVVTATCEGEGYNEYTCTRCNGVEKRDIVPALGHTYGDWMPIPDAFGGEPVQECRVCSTCQNVDVRNIGQEEYPTVPSDPTGPSDPSDPTDPSGTTDPSDPTDPSGSTDTTDPSNTGT